MPADELTPEQMAKLGGKDAEELTPEELDKRIAASSRPRAVDKKTGLPLVSPQLEAKMASEPMDRGMIRTHRVPGTTLNFVEKPEALTPGEKTYQHDREAEYADKKVIELATSGGLAGGLKTVLAAKLAKPAASTALGLNASSAFAKGGAKPIAERIADALGETVKHSIIARGIQLFAPGAIEVGKKAVAAGVAATPNVAATAAGELGARTPAPPVADEPAPFKGVMSNAVDRLRASAGNNPRAADLLARMEASKNTPTGTVTQGTGVHP